MYFIQILSGTPIQNRVQELWAAFDFLMPSFLGDLKSFEKRFARPIAKGNADGASAADIAKGIEILKLLHQTVRQFCSALSAQTVTGFTVYLEKGKEGSSS